MGPLAVKGFGRARPGRQGYERARMSQPSAPPSESLEHLRTRLRESEGRLKAALDDRDHALLELARERELVNTLRLSAQFQAEANPTVYPSAVGPDGPPLRYVVADRLSEGFKRL